MKKVTKNVFVSLLTAVTLAAPTVTMAQTISNLGLLTGDEDALKNLIIRIAGWVAGFAGFIALIYLIWGGVTYMTGGEKGATAGKTMITNAIIGLAIIALSVVIVNAVIGALNPGF